MSDVPTGSEAIFSPLIGMLLLALVVWVHMYVRRIHYMVAHRIDAQRLTTPERATELLPESIRNISNNLRNLFELPIAFYVLCLYLYVTGSVDALYVSAAWVFLVFRVLHSLVHCTFNRVMLRFALYMGSAITLWFMLLRASVALLN